VIDPSRPRLPNRCKRIGAGTRRRAALPLLPGLPARRPVECARAAAWPRTVSLSLMAHQAGLGDGEAGRRVRPAYAKVAEYEAHSAVHYHAITLLHAIPPAGDSGQAAPPLAARS
jgi:hypothetical protein